MRSFVSFPGCITCRFGLNSCAIDHAIYSVNPSCGKLGTWLRLRTEPLITGAGDTTYYPRYYLGMVQIFIAPNRSGLPRSTIVLEVELSDTIQSVKAKIKGISPEISPDRYFLLYAGKKLEDDRALDHYLVQRDSTLNLVFHHFRIDVKLTEKSRSKTIAVDHVNYITTIGGIKARINDEERIPPDQQVLTFDGKILQDDVLIGRHSIRKGSILHLKLRGEEHSRKYSFLKHT